MSRNNWLRAAWLSFPLFALVLSGCNRNTTVNRPSENTPQPTQYTAIDDSTSGAIVGTIRFTGKAPKPILIDMAQDPACSLAKTPNYTEQYVVHDGKMANVFVYIKDGLGNRVYMPTKTPVVLDQKGCRYIPHVIGVMAGQPVEFRNSDPTMHNVHIVPPGDSNAAGFDISQPPMGSPEQHVFRTPGPMIPVRCNNHPWMEAFLNVVKNPFFAVSGSDGKFEIQGLPPGNYTLVAVQEKLGAQSQPIVVQSRKTTDANFTFSK
ncbi:MAG: carboxypeptidase regulatory-like domain-containing protein [Acidobacteriaceae bacterium]